ncbi:MAG: glycoside hydrolase family 28 protein, partial [Treponema sp.]|nr:glycoside hydrolase family 28 protein [Treponema sp.]
MTYNVSDYGIVGDGLTNNTRAVRHLIDIVKEQGGGRIYFPAGKYVTGSMRLFSNMSLYLESGSVILGSPDFADYPLISKKDLPEYTRDTHSALITAINCENIVIEGNGKIDGMGHYWWKSLPSDLLRPRTIQPILCKNIQIKNITIVNSPCWTIHPVCCENLLVRGVSIINPYDSPNTDGINPESCKNVRISDCFVDVGDDCITIKAGTEEDLLQKKYSCENITITNCNMAHGHGGLVLGSEMSAGIKNISISNCVMQNTDRGIRIKTRRKRGGFVSNVMINNIVMENVKAAITINEYYSCGADLRDEELFSDSPLPVSESTPSISGINMNGIIGRNIKGVGIYMYGLPELPVSSININNVDFQVSGSEEGIMAISAIKREKSYGEGIFLENVQNIKINNVLLDCPREKIIHRNCRKLE